MYKIFAVITTFSFISYLYLGFYQYFYNHRSKVNRKFLFVCIAFAFWAFWYIFIFLFNKSPYFVVFEKLGYIGALSYDYFLIKFLIELTGFQKKIKNNLLFSILLAIVPLIIISQVILNNAVASDCPFGFWYIFHQIYEISYNSFCILLLFIWYKTSKLNREKKLASIIIFGAFITMGITLITDFVSGFLKIPTLTSALAVIWMFFIAYAMFKYKLLAVNFEYVSSYIINNIDEIIIISDSSGNIIASNNVCKKLCNLECVKLENIIKEYKFIENDISRLFIKKIKSFGGLFHILSKKKEVSFDLKFSIIVDDFKDPAGLLIIGKKLESYKNFIIRYRVTKREAQIIEEIISGKNQKEIADKLKITVYTLKRHVTNIYNKLGANNRVQLMNLLKDVHVISEHSVTKNKVFQIK